MVYEKNRLARQIKKLRDNVYKSQDGGYITELIRLRDFLMSNEYTSDIINNIKYKYPNVHWHPAEWVEPHIHLSSWWGDRENKNEPHEDIFEPTQPDECAAAAAIRIDHIINGDVNVLWLSQYTNGGYNRMHQQVTVRFIDPLINYLYFMIKCDDLNIMIPAGDSEKGKRTLQEIFQKVEGDIRICDPYIDRTAVIYISNINIAKATCIRILTVNNKRRNISDDELNNFKFLKKYFNVEMRAFVDNGHPIHDRYILSDSQCYKIGASFNYLGGKDTDITTMIELIPSWTRKFEERWQQAKPII